MFECRRISEKRQRLVDNEYYSTSIVLVPCQREWKQRMKISIPFYWKSSSLYLKICKGQAHRKIHEGWLVNEMILLSFINRMLNNSTLVPHLADSRVGIREKVFLIQRGRKGEGVRRGSRAAWIIVKDPSYVILPTNALSTGIQSNRWACGLKTHVLGFWWPIHLAAVKKRGEIFM